MGNITLETIHKDLEFLKKKIMEIRKHIVDVDAVLSKDEELLLKRAREEHERGETTSLEDLEKELSG